MVILFSLYRTCKVFTSVHSEIIGGEGGHSPSRKSNLHIPSQSFNCDCSALIGPPPPHNSLYIRLYQITLDSLDEMYILYSVLQNCTSNPQFLAYFLDWIFFFWCPLLNYSLITSLFFFVLCGKFKMKCQQTMINHRNQHFYNNHQTTKTTENKVNKYGYILNVLVVFIYLFLSIFFLAIGNVLLVTLDSFIQTKQQYCPHVIEFFFVYAIILQCIVQLEL